MWLQEEFFTEQSVDKAISIDEWTGETLSSSMVDDVFYILRMCCYRALDTVNLQALTAVLGQLNSLLANNLAQALEHRWKVFLMLPSLCLNPFPCQTYSVLCPIMCNTVGMLYPAAALAHYVMGNPLVGFSRWAQEASKQRLHDLGVCTDQTPFYVKY